ncbi:MAG: putative DNA binding domain-containing protein [Coriobacteriales bacterium]|jgi:ATP-dependent DNA helicase RecG|nr:putative DNA binding domain-containing protein [Coriobacteriales bacterium]
MLTVEHIKKILAEGEGLTVEFKKCENALSKSIYETVCSFANRYGGSILLGVSDDGEALGVSPEAAGAIKKDFANTVNNPQKMAPPLFLTLDEIEIDGKLVLYAYIPRTSQIQMTAGRIYDRNEDGDYDVTGSTELIAQMSIRKSNEYTERKVFPFAREEHLKLAELMPIVRQRALNRDHEHPWGDMADMEIMRSAGLYEEDTTTGVKGFNRAALLLFGRDEIIQQAAPGYVTDCLLRVENVDRYDDRLRVESNLIEAFGQIMGFIAKHTWNRFFLIDNLNVNVRDFIAKEIVSNVLVHREFSSAHPARVIVEKGRILAENWNRPLSPGRIDPDNFKPYPKNPILARFFVNIGYADTLGSGVRNLYKYTQMYSGKEPELIEGDMFQAIIPLNRTQDVPNDVPINVPINVLINATEKEVLDLITENPKITYAALAERLSLSSRTIQRSIAKLQGIGHIRREGSRKSGYWEIISDDSAEQYVRNV